MLAGAAAVGAPPAAGADVTEFLDVEVDQLDGAGAFVAAPPVRAVDGGGRVGLAQLLGLPELLAGGRVEVAQPGDAQPDQHLVHPGAGDVGAVGAAQLVGDAERAEVAFAAQPLDAGLELGWCAPRAVPGPRRALAQSVGALGEPPGVPFVQALPGDAGLGGDVGLGASAIDAQTQPALAFEGQRDMTVRHEDLQGRRRGCLQQLHTSPGGPPYCKIIDLGVSPSPASSTSMGGTASRPSKRVSPARTTTSDARRLGSPPSYTTADGFDQGRRTVEQPMSRAAEGTPAVDGRPGLRRGGRATSGPVGVTLSDPRHTVPT